MLEKLNWFLLTGLTTLAIGINLVDVHLNWVILFHFLILEGGLLVTLIDCMIFLSPFLDVIRISMSTVFFHCTKNEVFH